jgi:hypothetical protein
MGRRIAAVDPALCDPCVRQSRVGTHWPRAQYPRDALFKGRNIQELSVRDTSVGATSTLHQYFVGMPICQGTRSTQNAAMPLNLKDRQAVMNLCKQVRIVPSNPSIHTYVLADGLSDLSGLGNGETYAWGCNVSPSPTDVSPTENSWMLLPLHKSTLCYLAPHRTIPSLNFDFLVAF